MSTLFQSFDKCLHINCDNFLQINLIAAPLYVITTTTLDRDDGLKVLTSAVEAIRTSIKKYGGEFNEKAAVSLHQQFSQEDNQCE